jgi:hypothetical protein
MPAETGIQRGLIFLGSRMRGNDDRVVIQSFPNHLHRHFYVLRGGVASWALHLLYLADCEPRHKFVQGLTGR